MSKSDENKLDKEWIILILTAKEMGISAAEVRNFINKKQFPLCKKHNFFIPRKNVTTFTLQLSGYSVHHPRKKAKASHRAY